MAIMSIYRQQLSALSLEEKAQLKLTGFESYVSIFDGDMVFYIILIFVVLLTTLDFTHGCIRQISCHGIKRWKHLLGQYLVLSLVISAIFFVIGLLNLAIFSVINTLCSIDTMAFIRYNMAQLSIVLAFVGIGSFISYLTRNSGVGVTLSIFFVLFATLIPNTISMLTGNEVFYKYSLQVVHASIMDLSTPAGEINRCIIFLLVISVISVVSSICLFSKRDID